MSSIHVLDQSTVDKIAAGEVVERPASVVKELTENALDAGSTRITVEIRDGGIALIRVTDNGEGIAPDDISRAFLRHATSKISAVSDLDALASLGFRGEALSSIAAVSRVELITKRAENVCAVRSLVEGGQEKLTEEIGAPDGTTIIVRDLFYNTPARAKFLKSPVTEASHAGSLVEQLALSNPSVAFTFIVNGRTRLVTSGNGSLKDAVCQVFGREITEESVPVSYEDDGIRITGLIGKPSIGRGNRGFESYYVNGRYLKSRILQKAIEDGYGTKLMNHQYPFTCLMIETDSSVVDVNVHPTKMDVRFSDEKGMYDAVRTAVSETLRNMDMILHAEIMTRAEERRARREEEERRGRREEEETQKASSGRPAAEISSGMIPEEELPPSEVPDKPVPAENTRRETPQAFESRRIEKERQAAFPGVREESAGHYEQQTFAPAFLSREAKPLRRIVGQVFSTYWICEFDDKMYLFDQHAAHEKVLYEALMKQYAEHEALSQELLPAMIVSLTAKEEGILLSAMEAFRAVGFDVEPFGERDYAVRAVPYSLVGIDSGELFKQMLDDIGMTGDVRDLDAYVHRVATEACKAAVKGGGRISEAEAAQLLDDLMALEDPYHCPHGRPTIISFTRQDLEKRFKRIL